MIWNKKKDGAENPGAETPAAQTTKAPVLFLQKNWKWLVPVVCVVIAGGVFLLKPKNASTTAVDPSYLEASPEVRDVSNTLSGTGTLNPANTYTVKSLVEGKVLTGEFEEGDMLDEGTVLYTLDSSDASTNFEKAEIAMQQAQRSYDKVVDRQYVRAEVDGTVSTLKVAKGDEVTSGQEVAVKTADLLGIRVYERELIRLACEYGELSEKTLSPSDEKATNPYLFQTVHEGNHHVLRGKPTSEVLFALQSHEIRRIARHEECVFVGRCADYVLRGEDVRLLTVFIAAPDEHRIQRKMAQEKLTRDQAIRLIRKMDKQRRKYYESYTHKAWGAPEGYDLYLDTGALSTADAAAVIAERFRKL